VKNILNPLAIHDVVFFGHKRLVYPVLKERVFLVMCAVDIALERRFQLWAIFADFNGLFAIAYQLTPLRANAD